VKLLAYIIIILKDIFLYISWKLSRWVCSACLMANFVVSKLVFITALKQFRLSTFSAQWNWPVLQAMVFQACAAVSSHWPSCGVYSIEAVLSSS